MSLEELFGTLIAEIKGMREDFKALEKRIPLEWDPEKLKASTKDPAALPPLSVVQPKDPTQPNLVEPWPPGRTQQRPGLRRPDNS